MDKGLCDSLAFVKEEIAKGVSCLFDRYDFTLLRSDTLPGSGLVMIGEHLSTRLNEKNDAYATGSVRVVIEPIPNTNLCLIRVRWFAPLRKGYEAKQQQQEGLYQKKFLNELVFHIKHQSS